KRRGSVDAGNTVSDYFPVEKEYGYSVFATVFNAEFNGKKLNVVDCPGADDFVGNSYTALGVCDTSVLVVNAQNGVEVGTNNAFRVTAALKKPVIFALNQLDGEKADFDNVLEQMRDTYGPKLTVIQYPLETGPGFHSMIDVLLMKKYEWGPDGGTPVISEIPADQMDRANELHNALVEAAAENDETLMDKYFEQGHLTEDEMREGIRKGLVDRSIFPLFVVSAQKDMGVRRMMEFLGNVCPFVSDMPAPETVNGLPVAPDAEGPLSVFVFKTSVEPHIGEVSYFKVMSGTLKAGDDLENVSRGGRERLAQIFTVCGQIRTAADTLVAGDIGAAVKLKDVRAGNTLDEKGCEYQFDFIKYPAPKFVRAIRPVTESDAEKLAGILTRMHEEDPTWVIEQSKELKQTLVKGQGEFHLRTLKWRVENNDKLPVEFSEQKIPYRETITKAARADYRHKKQSGGSGQFGEVHLIVEPYT
ncbi:MAG: GTP-binding protein, partial [Muribaculaceae bacterium]|nr:GTP-binding protein [Muribaculaceae bacterium]